MKTTLLALLFFTSILWTSCCERVYDTDPRIWITYESDYYQLSVYQIRTEKGNISNVFDSIRLNPINSHGNDQYSNQPTFEPKFIGDYEYMLWVPSTGRIDTMASVSHTRGKCNIMKEVAYLWNGVYSNDNHRYIDLK